MNQVPCKAFSPTKPAVEPLPVGLYFPESCYYTSSHPDGPFGTAQARSFAPYGC